MSERKLSEKYLSESGIVYLTGIQALVRLPIDQMRRDRKAGLKTGTFISGYEGSPLGGYDLALMREKKLLDEYNIHFRSGLNEEIAATSVFGSTILDTLANEKKVDGVFGIWYGKGPGVDRCGDIFRHANAAGTSPNSAALVLAGDDHACKSSTIPHQSDFALMSAAIPFFFPANQQDLLDYGMYSVALSRFSASWVGMKCVTDVCDGGSTVRVDPHGLQVVLPEGYQRHFDVRFINPFTLKMEQEASGNRLEAARQFARLNKINKWHGARDGAWLGIAATGKAWVDVLQAVRDLGLDLDKLGIRLGKVAMPFPLEPEFARDFALGLQTLLVVEEKRSFVETQFKEILYGVTNRPAVLGKADADGTMLFPANGELNPEMIAVALARILGDRIDAGARLARIKPAQLPTAVRSPNFCSGCPHNRSTMLLEGQVAGGGIGCHTMAMGLGPGRAFQFMTQMGGEGAPWIGMSPFVDRQHIFQNIGDGTFFHSGQLAVEACIAAGVNITYKILYNGHVAMTGGQHAQGALPVPQLCAKLKAEGVRKIVILAEEVERYHGLLLPEDVELRDREELPRTLAEMEKLTGVTAIIYDQECAAEKRRARSRGKMVEPTKRLVINEQVCEGCGDCVKQSNCMSLAPVMTEYGQKMKIHQSSCNKDYSCALGDCPSFVTVNLKPGTGQTRKTLPKLPDLDIPAPTHVAVIGDHGYRILCPGVGGTGVLTVNALLATAAWLDGLSVLTLDQTGSAQKGGAAVSHITFSKTPIEAPGKINLGNADLILGFDLVGATSGDNLKCADPNKTTIVVNSSIVPTAENIRSRTLLGPQTLIDQVDAATQRGRNVYVDANRLAEALFGSHMAVNLFLTGVAWQAGLIPISFPSFQQAIQLNGVDIERNLQTFNWGRKYYHDAKWVEQHATPTDAPTTKESFSIARRVKDLTTYQNAAIALEYEAFITEITAQAPELEEPVGRYLYKLMAVKDEYEVARMLTSPEFENNIRQQFANVESIGYNLHPPMLKQFGVTKKLKLGAWARPLLRVLAGLKGLRGTAFDVFGYSAHRRLERSLPAWYKDVMRQAVALRDAGNATMVLDLARLPDQIRGYEQIKEESIDRVKSLAQAKLQEIKQLQLTQIV